MSNEKAKKRQSTRHAKRYDVQKHKTTANKVRKAKKWARIWAKRRKPERVARLKAARLKRREERAAARKPKNVKVTVATISAGENLAVAEFTD